MAISKNSVLRKHPKDEVKRKIEEDHDLIEDAIKNIGKLMSQLRDQESLIVNHLETIATTFYTGGEVREMVSNSHGQHLIEELRHAQKDLMVLYFKNENRHKYHELYEEHPATKKQEVFGTMAPSNAVEAHVAGHNEEPTYTYEEKNSHASVDH